MAELSDRVAVVTGGGTGIGAACARQLAAAGARVIITGRRREPLDEIAESAGEGQTIVGRTCDVADRQDVDALFAGVESDFGPVSILIHSAGINVPDRAMSKLTPEDWDRVLHVNATGAYNCLRRVLPGMREQQDGLIVNISSVAGCRASELGGVAYTASKFALSGMGLTVALEEREHGIRVTTVYPGEVDTPILDNRPVPVSAEHRARILQADDVAEAVLMVCRLPARAHVPELVIKPTSQPYA